MVEIASYTIKGGTTFAEGVSVSAYPAVQIGPEGGPPSGTATSTATVTNGSLTFTGLADNTEYVAYAASPNRYRRFRTDPATTAATVLASSSQWPGGVVGRKVTSVRSRTLDSVTAQRLADYEPRRFRIVVDNPTGSGNNIVLGYNVAKNRNTAGTFPITVTPGQTFVSDTFYPYPLWAKTSAGTLAISVRQEVVADR